MMSLLYGHQSILRTAYECGYIVIVGNKPLIKREILIQLFSWLAKVIHGKGGAKMLMNTSKPRLANFLIQQEDEKEK